MAFVYTPYDGSKRPFTIGLEPLDPAEWLEIDAHRAAHLAEKAALIASDRDAVFRADPDSLPAQQEAAALIRSFLFARGIAAEEEVKLGEPPLLAISQHVQEDLILMRRDGAAWRLSAGALCFPSSWSLAEKFGQSMAVIHEEVPGFHGRMEHVVGRIFDSLRPEQPVWRLNWAIYGDDLLRHDGFIPPEERFASNMPIADQAFIRVERQTLRKLPLSGAILFTIRIHLDPMAALARHPRRRELALGLREQVLGLDHDQLDYKGMTESRDRLAAALAELAGEP